MQKNQLFKWRKSVSRPFWWTCHIET